MAILNVTAPAASNFEFYADALFYGAGISTLVSNSGTKIVLTTGDGFRLELIGIGFMIDAAATAPWIAGTVTGIRLLDAAGAVGLVEMSGLSSSLSEFGSFLESGNVADLMASLMSGNDTLSGGFGFDDLRGGDGNDHFSMGVGPDAIWGGDGFDTASFEVLPAGAPAPTQGVTVSLASNTGSNQWGEFFLITEVEKVVGSSLADSVEGSDVDDHLYGMDGNDILDGGYGGKDVIDGGKGNDIIVGGDGDDLLFGGEGDDTIFGGSTNGSWGSEGPGNNVVDGGVGADTFMLFGLRNDFTLVRLADGSVKVTEKSSGRYDLLSGIERISFNGTTMSLDDALMATNTLPEQIADEDSPWTMTLPSGVLDPTATRLQAALANGSALPAWIRFDAATKTFSGTPPLNFSGTIDLKVVTLDGSAPSSVTFTLWVRDVNDAPGAISITSTQVAENSANGTVVGTLSAYDVDGRPTFSLLDDAAGIFEIVGDKIMVRNGAKLDFEQVKIHQIKVKATDEFGASSVNTFNITVADVYNEVVYGTTGNDKLVGGAGADKFFGGLGNDTLTGGKGKDAFVFNTKLNKSTNVDTVTDFSVKDDTFHLENAIFKKVGSKAGTLKKDFFTIGPKAKDKNDYVVYDNKKGYLYYDADGSGKGAAVLIAKVGKGHKMTHKDFFVI
ncbi:putative Ig domain-containing protein [Microvirga sp. ACRRW]|uniref:putative Ig domain-containing protein n=1 Tax=Microvirga sp. ACRRW TaxID=2918205 RepID=UPI001EF5B4E9|nr:putative Ig domain-containing protein [Microvirga sp. ACRRW]MCG7392896.1 putative Ig domain-containing protein [Microvirga sp. ACRRW]